MSKKPEVWKRLHRKVVLDHPRLRIVEDEVQLPDGSSSTYVRQAPTESQSVIVIAVNTANELLLQKEYSYPPNEIMWQLPGGSVDPGEDVILAAKRELSEESGFSARNCEMLGWYYTSNRFSDQKQYIVLCTDLFSHKLQEDQEEFIETHWIAINAVDEMISSGQFNNINLLAALNVWLHNKRA